MGKIFCLMGKSASGKDTIYGRLLKESRVKLKPVVPYTTRPMRDGEVAGENYFFCTEEEEEALARAGKIIELRQYDTVYGVWKYFTVDDGRICLDKNDYLMIGTLETYAKIRDYFGEEYVYPIYVWTDDGVRLSRALSREQSQKEPKYAEMCRRFLADEKDFSTENLIKYNIKIQFENNDIELILDKICSYIENAD